MIRSNSKELPSLYTLVDIEARRFQPRAGPWPGRTVYQEGGGAPNLDDLLTGLRESTAAANVWPAKMMGPIAMIRRAPPIDVKKLLKALRRKQDDS